MNGRKTIIDVCVKCHKGIFRRNDKRKRSVCDFCKKRHKIIKHSLKGWLWHKRHNT